MLWEIQHTQPALINALGNTAYTASMHPSMLWEILHSCNMKTKESKGTTQEPQKNNVVLQHSTIEE